MNIATMTKISSTMLQFMNILKNLIIRVPLYEDLPNYAHLLIPDANYLGRPNRVNMNHNISLTTFSTKHF